MMGTVTAKNALGFLMVALFAAASAVSTVHAAGDGGGYSRTWATDPVIEQMQGYTSRKDWQGAAALMKTAVERNPGSADYNNLYAYTMRKGPDPNMEL